MDRIEARLVREPAEGKIATVTLELILGGALDEDQRRRLHEVAARCPVHRTLTEGIRIVDG